MKRSKSSRRWLDEHFSDHYVKEAKKLGYRSRACFKLIEIQEKDRIIKRGMKLVDLGASPGGWSQMAVDWIGESGRIFALDILPMESIPFVDFIQGDFTQESVLEDLLKVLGGVQVDLILSDMSPNTSGMKAVDGPKAMLLCELALDFCDHSLRHKGAFLVKVFQGIGFDNYLKLLRQKFERVVVRKPLASRARSKEVYMLATGFKK